MPDDHPWRDFHRQHVEQSEVAYLKALDGGMEDPVVSLTVDYRIPPKKDGRLTAQRKVVERSEMVDWFRARCVELSDKIRPPAPPGMYTVVVMVKEGPAVIQQPLTVLNES